MANKPNQKLKLLYVLQMLLEKTDDTAGITTQDIIEELALLGIDAERKSINRDIQTLRDFGLDVQQRSHKYWYLASRPLSLQEITMLVDAVQSAPFLTDKITGQLIGRLKQLASAGQRDALGGRIEMPVRVKMQNESVLENLNAIQQAMQQKRKVEFQYFQYDINKKRVVRKEGGVYTATPVRLVYADEFYYLVAFSDRWANQEGHNPFTNYRVDRMGGVKVSERPATKDARIANYLVEDNISPSFGVFSAEKVAVTLEADESAMNMIIDKFGVGALTFTTDDDRVQVHVKAPLSPRFYSWLFMLAPHVKITQPQRAVKEAANFIERMRKVYAPTYRICSSTACRLVTQEQFLELVGFVEGGLRSYVESELDGIGFATENDFDCVAWRLINQWAKSNKVSDGLPAGAEEFKMPNGKRTILNKPVSFDDYLAFGQLVGEVIIAVQPAEFASPASIDSFTNTAEKFDDESAGAFTFRMLPANGTWSTRIGSSRRHYVGNNGAYYEICYEEIDGSRCSQAYFEAPEFGVQRTALNDVGGWLKRGGEVRAVMKHWQMIAYRFA